jgi:hypothetical protein
LATLAIRPQDRPRSCHSINPREPLDGIPSLGLEHFPAKHVLAKAGMDAGSPWKMRPNPEI